MSIVPKLRSVGFRPGLRMNYLDGKYVFTREEASDVPPPLVYAVVDRNGESVRTGRSLKQTIWQREKPTPRGLNFQSTEGQNNKAVIRCLRVEIKENGPLTSYVRRSADEETAKEEEKELYDHVKGRCDRRRG